MLPPGEGEAFWTLGGHFTMKLAGKAGIDGLSLLEARVNRDAEPPLHIHHREDEAWYVLDGRMTFYLGDQAFVAEPGAFVFAPMGIAHVFTVDVEPTRVLVAASPSGFEHFALELGVPATGDAPPPGAGTLDPAVLGPVAERYGIEVIGPPRRISHPESG